MLQTSESKATKLKKSEVERSGLETPELETSEPTISIIVPCRNERGWIGPMLESILAQDLGGRVWEAIIADGMSTDGTREILNEFSLRNPKVRVIDNPPRTTPSALNLAIQQSSGKVIVRMDVHTVYAPMRRYPASNGSRQCGRPSPDESEGLPAFGDRRGLPFTFCMRRRKVPRP